MIILGIDPGYDRLGLAIIEKKNNKENILFSTCIETNKKDSVIDRIFFIGQEINKLIKEYRPEILAIETLYFNKNTKTAMGVSEARGVVIYECKKAGLKITEYTPSQIKTATTSYGAADKRQVYDMVSRILALDLGGKRDDEIDAIAVALTSSAHEKSL